MQVLRLDRVSCHVTAKCNLKCYKCSAYIPELYALSTPIPEYTLEQTKHSFQTYFEMVSFVRMISLSGGEPFVFSELAKLVEFLLGYENQFEKLEIFTNGTIPLHEKLLTICSKSKKVSFLVDNYGPEVSKQVDAIEASLKEFGISYQIRKYYGIDAHMGGWHDYCITGTKVSEDEAKFRFEKCYSGKNGNMLSTIFGNRIFLCPLSEVGRRIGRIPIYDILFVDLDDDHLTIEEKQERFLAINNAALNPACAYCNGIGVYENEARYTPGIQIT